MCVLFNDDAGNSNMYLKKLKGKRLCKLLEKVEPLSKASRSPLAGDASDIFEWLTHHSLHLQKIIYLSVGKLFPDGTSESVGQHFMINSVFHTIYSLPVHSASPNESERVVITLIDATCASDLTLKVYFVHRNHPCPSSLWLFCEESHSAS